MADAVRFNVVMWYNETIHLKKYIMCSTLMQKGKKQAATENTVHMLRELITSGADTKEIPSVCVRVCVRPVAAEM